MEAVHAYDDDDACYVLVYMVLVLWQQHHDREAQLELAELAGSVYEAVKWQRISDAHHHRPHERISIS
jgi:hypothetical protein